MKRLVLHSAPILLLVFQMSCKQGPVSPVLGVDRSHPVFEMIDYTSVRILDNGNVSRSMDDVDRVGFGRIAGVTYDEQVIVYPTISKQNNSYYVHFDTVVTIPDSGFTQSVRLRLYLKSGITIDRDTSFTLFHYPFRSAQVVLLPSDFPDIYTIQDIAFVRDTMYILYVGDSKLHLRAPGQSIQFYRNIYESDFLAGDSCYVFIDNDITLSRFNIDIGAFDYTLRQIPNPFLAGVAAENGIVYALYPQRSLVLLDRNGQLLDSMQVPFNAFHIAVYDGVLYANVFTNNTIARFDTKTKTLLPPLKAPVTNIEGMEIYQGYLYIGDYNRRALFRVPFQDISSQLASSNAEQARLTGR